MAIAAADLAKLAYEAYRGYASAVGLVIPAYSVLDIAITDEMEDDVDTIIADDALTVEQVHQGLVGIRVAAGWKYGLEYNATAKTDPLLVDYDALSVHERVRRAILLKVVIEGDQFIGFA